MARGEAIVLIYLPQCFARNSIEVKRVCDVAIFPAVHRRDADHSGVVGAVDRAGKVALNAPRVTGCSGIVTQA